MGENDGVAIRILRDCGVDPEKIRASPIALAANPPIGSVSECSAPCGRGGVGARERVWAVDEEKAPRRSPVRSLSTSCVRQGN